MTEAILLSLIIACAGYLGYQWCQDQVVTRLEHNIDCLHDDLRTTYLFQKRNERGQFVK